MSDPANRTDTASPGRMLDMVLARGDQTVIARIGALEQMLPSRMLRRARQALLTIGRPSQRRPDPPDDFDELEGEVEYQELWDGLIRDWRRDIEVGLVTLSGVPTHPELSKQFQDIPGAWASEMVFDFINNTILIGGIRRMGAIEVRIGGGHTAHAVKSEEVGAKFSPAAFDVAELTADQVAMLLERHADYVVRTIGVKLLLPGKASPMALITVKMRERAAVFEMESTIGREAEWLARWAKEAAPSYPAVQPKSISSKLSGYYKDLRRKFPPRDM